MLKKNYIVLILVIIILIVCGLGLLMFNQFQLGTSYVSLPKGYHADTHEDRVVNLTNGTDSLILNEYTGSNPDIMVPVKYYKGSKEKQNLSVNLKDFNVDGIKVYKTSVHNGTYVYHYWFVKNDKLYEVVSYDGNNKTDGLVSDIIKSMKSSII